MNCTRGRSSLYVVDGVGNRTNFHDSGDNPYTYDSDDEPTGAGGVNTFIVGYNANGDRTSESFNGQVTTFGYDFDDQLTSLSEPGTTVLYRYDPLGRQVSKQVNGTLTGYYLDGETVLIEKQGSVTTAQYLWGDGLVRCNGEYPLTDGRGNVRLATNASQQVTSSSQPDAFGLGSVTAGTASAYQWNGSSGYREEGLGPAGLSSYYGFQKVGARYYDQAFGCFLTRDTLLSQKPYAYCDGDPVNAVDPSGHDSTSTNLGKLGLALQLLKSIYDGYHNLVDKKPKSPGGTGSGTGGGGTGSGTGGGGTGGTGGGSGAPGAPPCVPYPGNQWIYYPSPGTWGQVPIPH